MLHLPREGAGAKRDMSWGPDKIHGMRMEIPDPPMLQEPFPGQRQGSRLWLPGCVCGGRATSTYFKDHTGGI